MVCLSLTTRSVACFLWCLPATRTRGDMVSSASRSLFDSISLLAGLSLFAASNSPLANSVVAITLVIVVTPSCNGSLQSACPAVKHSFQVKSQPVTISYPCKSDKAVATTYLSSHYCPANEQGPAGKPVCRRGLMALLACRDLN